MAAPHAAVGLLLLSVAAHAQVWTWHNFDALLPAGRNDILLHVRPGTIDGEFAYVQAGATLRTPVHKRLVLQAGYLYTTNKTTAVWSASSRVVGGAEVSAGPMQFRGNIERFLPDTAPDYFRYRQRALFTMRRRVAPVLSLEMFFDRHGVIGTRPSGGVRWRANAWSSIETAYFFDARPLRAGGNRHVIVTTWTIRPRSR